jgi:hypothetical protein
MRHVMDDRLFILETLRRIGETSISAAQEAAIMAAPDVAEPATNDWEQAHRRRAIVEETLRAFGLEELMWRGVYSDVFKACKNIDEGLATAEATVANRSLTDTRADRRAFA